MSEPLDSIERKPVKLDAKPQASTTLSLDTNLLLEEFKLVCEESRFTMTRYMQMLAIYVFLIGLIVRELAHGQGHLRVSILTVIAIVVSLIACFGAKMFRSMAYHYLDRAALIADELKVQRPHPMVWGYWAGMTAFWTVIVLASVFAFLWFAVLSTASPAGTANG